MSAILSGCNERSRCPSPEAVLHCNVHRPLLESTFSNLAMPWDDFALVSRPIERRSAPVYLSTPTWAAHTDSGIHVTDAKGIWAALSACVHLRPHVAAGPLAFQQLPPSSRPQFPPASLLPRSRPDSPGSPFHLTFSPATPAAPHSEAALCLFLCYSRV